MGIYMLITCLIPILNFHCVIIYQNIDLQIEYFLEKVLNFEIFYRDNKS